MLRQAKTFIIILAIVAVVVAMGNWWREKRVKDLSIKTIENLRTAWKQEKMDSIRYAVFAEGAWREGYSRIAILFAANAKADGVHAWNHQRVLEKFHITVSLDSKSIFKNRGIRDNLCEAIRAEKYEVGSMYSDFLKTANEANIAPAIRTFTRAMDSERKQRELFQKALDAVVAVNGGHLSTVYYVCPVCGNIFDRKDVEANCSFCSTSKDKYIVYK